MAGLVFLLCLACLIFRHWDGFVSILAWFFVFYLAGCLDLAVGIPDNSPFQFSMIWVYLTVIWFGIKIAFGGRG